VLSSGLASIPLLSLPGDPFAQVPHRNPRDPSFRREDASVSPLFIPLRLDFYSPRFSVSLLYPFGSGEMILS